MPNGQAWPRITIVTPSFNQGQFIEETITSVIGQHYPNLEYIVMDGGSSDETVEVIKRYERHIHHWQSEKDGGQAAAINAGFARSSGDILAWLNSDDFYLPGALHFIAAQMNANQAQIVTGNCFHFVENEARAHGSDVVKHHARSDLKLWDYIVQPSSFWTRQAWQQTGKLNEDLNFAFDWEWFIRCQKSGVEFSARQKYLSAYRFHGAHKTGTGGEKRYAEIAEIYRTHAGEKYEQLFQTLRQSARGINRVKRVSRLARVPAIESALLKRAFPTIYRNFNAQEIEDVSSMCH